LKIINSTDKSKPYNEAISCHPQAR